MVILSGSITSEPLLALTKFPSFKIFISPALKIISSSASTFEMKPNIININKNLFFIYRYQRES